MHCLPEKINLLKLTLWQFTNHPETNQPTVSSQTRHSQPCVFHDRFLKLYGLWEAATGNFVVISYFYFHKMSLLWAWNELCKLHIWYEDPYNYLFVLASTFGKKKLLISVKNCESSELFSTLICIRIQFLCSLLFSPLTTTFIFCLWEETILYSMKFKNIHFLFVQEYTTSGTKFTIPYTATLSRCYNTITSQNILILSFICTIISQEPWETKQFKRKNWQNQH